MRDALVVGINTYQNLPNLQSPAADAENIAHLLEQYGEFNVRRLPEAINANTLSPYVSETIPVNLIDLQQALINLFNPQGRNIPDTALFYFSGHGIRETSGLTSGFLATSNANPNIGFNGLFLQWLRQLLRESPIKQQIIWLDCCYSGELLNLNEADAGGMGKVRDRCFIAASREFEVAYEGIATPYSALTEVLLKGLEPNRCPGRWVTNYSLIDYLINYFNTNSQCPIFSNFGGSINLTKVGEISPPPPPEISTICPYKGLQYFDCNETDPQYFFGREELTDQLLDQIRQSNFLAILGASGSGKSSVLRAGLLHQLKLGQNLSGSERWQIHIIEPGEHPLDSLALAFVNPNSSQIERANEFGIARELLQKGSEGLDALVQCSEATKIVIAIDQFEESFFLCQDQAEREKFFQCLLETLEKANQKLCLIIAMRADFLSNCLEYEYSGLGKTIQENLATVTPMNQEQLREAIIRPAQQVKLTVEPILVKQMLGDVEGLPGSLPLLQYTLTELWKQTNNGSLRLNTYTQLGGIAGTLNKRATEVYDQFDNPEKETVKHIFCCLTQLGEDRTGDTIKRVLKQDLITAQHPIDLIDRVLQRLINEKLIITSQPNLSQNAIGGRTLVEVVHETLIRHWQILRQWLDDSREYLLQRKKIEAAAEDWRRHDRSSHDLLQGKRLQAARDFQQQQGENFPLSQVAEEFIQVSIQQKRNKQIQFIGILSIISFIGIGIGGGSIWYLNELKAQQELQKKISLGEEYFIDIDSSLEKKNGADLFAHHKFKEAADKFQQSLNNQPNDPEARIYLNNANAKATNANANSFTIAVAVPIKKSENVAQEILRGVAQAQQEVKEQGGINGKPLQVEIVSDDNDTDLAKNLAKQLVKDGKILAVVGHNASEISTSAANVYQGKLVMISATSVSSLNLREIMKSQPVNYIFRVVPASQETRSFFKKYISENFPHSRLLNCYDSISEDNNWVFKNDSEIEIMNIKCDFKISSLNLEKVIEDAINKKANGLFLATHVNTIDHAISVAKNRKNLNLFGTSTIYTSETLKFKQARDFEGMILSVYWHPDAIKNKLNKKFLEEAKHLWGKEVIQEADITWRTAMAYDATKAIIEGLKKLNTPTRAGLQQVLSNSSFEFEGVTGKVQFQQGERKSNAALCYIVRIKKQESANDYYFEPLDKCPSN